MKRENRIRGMVVCLVLLGLSAFVAGLTNEAGIEVLTLISMFVGGYGLRETLDRSKEE